MGFERKFEVLPDAEKVELQKSKEGIFVKDDILFRRVAKKVVFVTGGKQYKRFNVQICIPSDNNIKRAVLYSVHGIPISGHDGKARSRQRLEDLDWWPSYEKDLASWVDSCFFARSEKPWNPEGTV